MHSAGVVVGQNSVNFSLDHLNGEESQSALIGENYRAVMRACCLDLDTCNKLVTLWVNYINNRQVQPHHKGPVKHNQP